MALIPRSEPKWHSWWRSLTQAWPDLRSALSQSEFRGLTTLAVSAFLLVIGIDVVAGLLKYMGHLSPEVARFYRLSEQGSLGEFTGYITMQMAVLFTLMLSIQLQSSLHMMIAVLLEYLLLDDMFMLHEAAGSSMAQLLFSKQSLLPSVALGELCFGGMFCLVMVGVFVVATRASTPYLRSLCALLFAPLCLLAFCSVGVDFLHALVSRDAKFLDGIMALVEDGGELLAMLLLMLVAVAQWLVFSLWPYKSQKALISP
jgi:hypothetical protein